jgi:alkyl sulfatase BDS1-like metallo-beta-lactamase superfamily hydrolase
VEYIVRGIYQGVIGWWADDAADLHPPTPEEFGAAIIEGFGGSDNVVKRAQSAFDEKKYNLTAKLLSTILAADPDNSVARHLKAAALRRMAQATRSGVQTRNFMLVQALRLEGKLNERAKTKMNALVTPFIDYEVMLDEKPGVLLRLLENHIDAGRSEGLIATIKFVVPDQNTSCGLAIRRGAVEFLNLAPDHYDLEITFNHPILAQIAAGHLTLQKAIDQGLAAMTGNLHLQKDVMESYTGILGA